MLLLRIAVLLLVNLFFLQPAIAITIDSFADEAAVSSTSTAGASRSVYIPSSSALGGGRSLSATKTGTGSGTTVVAMGEASLTHNQGFHGGTSSIIWDGDTNPNTINPKGLGSVDLTQDGGTALKIRVQFFNFPVNTPIDISVRMYDASTADGSRFSEIILQLNQAWIEDGPRTLTIDIPFQSLGIQGLSNITPTLGIPLTAITKVGPNGPARPTAVGAISLTFHGESNNRTPYITLLPLTTDGRCMSVMTTEGRALDECGVCLESGNANSGKDRCGTCLHGPNGYSYPVQRTADGCWLCPGEANYRPSEGNKDECRVCFSGPPPYTYRSIRDICGTCGGGKTSVSQCSLDNDNCTIVEPTPQILAFEKVLLVEANKLFTRFSDAQRNYGGSKCSGSLKGTARRVANAHRGIVARAQQTFRSTIANCNKSCRTVSYAANIKALAPKFRVLEQENLSTARKLEQCFRRIGKAPPKNGSARETSQAIVATRSKLGALEIASSRARVCKNS